MMSNFLRIVSIRTALPFGSATHSHVSHSHRAWQTRCLRQPALHAPICHAPVLRALLTAVFSSWIHLYSFDTAFLATPLDFYFGHEQVWMIEFSYCRV